MLSISTVFPKETIDVLPLNTPIAIAIWPLSYKYAFFLQFFISFCTCFLLISSISIIFTLVVEVFFSATTSWYNSKKTGSNNSNSQNNIFSIQFCIGNMILFDSIFRQMSRPYSLTKLLLSFFIINLLSQILIKTFFFHFSNHSVTYFNYRWICSFPDFIRFRHCIIHFDI